jgi:hypothetical protein
VSQGPCGADYAVRPRLLLRFCVASYYFNNSLLGSILLVLQYRNSCYLFNEEVKIMALCKWEGGACERETDDKSGLCSKHRGDLVFVSLQRRGVFQRLLGWLVFWK